MYSFSKSISRSSLLPVGHVCVLVYPRSNFPSFGLLSSTAILLLHLVTHLKFTIGKYTTAGQHNSVLIMYLAIRMFINRIALVLYLVLYMRSVFTNSPNHVITLLLSSLPPSTLDLLLPALRIISNRLFFQG